MESQLRQAGMSIETALVIGTRSDGDEIVSYAAEGHFDLIAMAADSRPWYKRLLCGAQDDDVLRKAGVPTLFVVDVPALQRDGFVRRIVKLHPFLALDREFVDDNVAGLYIHTLCEGHI